MKECDICKLSTCFWCGKEKNELIMLSNKAKAIDRKNWCNNKNMSVVTSYEPCDKCKKEFSAGTHVIEVSDTPLSRNQPPIRNELYPTGHMWVIKTEAAKDIFNNDSKTILIDNFTAKLLKFYPTEEEPDNTAH